MEVKKIYVSGNNEATVTCPSCGKWKTANVASYAERHEPIKIRCSCGTAFRVTFEWRQQYRKKVNLVGTYSKNGGNREPMVIENISVGGVGFNVTKGNLEKGDIVEIEFRLDDNKRSVISEKVVVKLVRDRHVGAEFLSPSVHTEKLLGFYLL